MQGFLLWCVTVCCVDSGEFRPSINTLVPASGASCCTLHCAVRLTSHHLCPLWLGCCTLHQVCSVDGRLAALLLWPLGLLLSETKVSGYAVFNLYSMSVGCCSSVVFQMVGKFPPANSVIAGPFSVPMLGLVCYINHSGNVC